MPSRHDKSKSKKDESSDIKQRRSKIKVKKLLDDASKILSEMKLEPLSPETEEYLRRLKHILEQAVGMYGN